MVYIMLHDKKAYQYVAKYTEYKQRSVIAGWCLHTYHESNNK